MDKQELEDLVIVSLYRRECVKSSSDLLERLGETERPGEDLEMAFHDAFDVALEKGYIDWDPIDENHMLTMLGESRAIGLGEPPPRR